MPETSPTDGERAELIAQARAVANAEIAAARAAIAENEQLIRRAEDAVRAVTALASSDAQTATDPAPADPALEAPVEPSLADVLATAVPAEQARFAASVADEPVAEAPVEPESQPAETPAADPVADAAAVVDPAAESAIAEAAPAAPLDLTIAP